MIFVISGLVLAALLIILAAIQTTLEIAEDARAGALSIARALLLSALAGFWLVFAVNAGNLGYILAVGLLVLWFSQQLLGRILGRAKFAETLSEQGQWDCDMVEQIGCSNPACDS